MKNNTALYKRLMSSINQDDPKQVELVKALFNQLEEYWACVELIKSEGGYLTETAAGGRKAHPAIAIKNAALKDVKDIAKLLGVDSNNVKEVVKTEKPKSVKELLNKKNT